MSDLSFLAGLEGAELQIGQIRAILNQIDLDVLNLVRDGKLAAVKYSVGGTPGAVIDRGQNLTALLQARAYYEQLLRSHEDQAAPAWQTQQADLDHR